MSDVLLQLAVNGLAIGCGYALVALGFSLILATADVFHFAHGAVFTLGAFLLFALAGPSGGSVIIAMVLTAPIVVLVGIAIWGGVYQPLRERGGANAGLTILLASVGLALAMENVIAMIWGRQQVIVPSPIGGGFRTGAIFVAWSDVAAVLTTAVVYFAVWYGLQRSPVGRALRALADNRDMAETLGLNIKRLSYIALGFGSLLAMPAAVIIAMHDGAIFNMGFFVIIVAVMAVTFGGVGSITGSLVGALLFGLVENVSAAWVGTQWGRTIALAALVILVISRPTGFFTSRSIQLRGGG